MKQRPRIYYTESQKALMWERWQKGESLQQIAQLFNRNHSSIQRILAETGGIRPTQRSPFQIGADPGRTRRDIARSGCRSLDPLDRNVARARTLHDQPRDQAQRWSRMLSSESGRAGRLGSGASPQDL